MSATFGKHEVREALERAVAAKFITTKQAAQLATIFYSIAVEGERPLISADFFAVPARATGSSSS